MKTLMNMVAGFAMGYFVNSLVWQAKMKEFRHEMRDMRYEHACSGAVLGFAYALNGKTSEELTNALNRVYKR